MSEKVEVLKDINKKLDEIGQLLAVLTFLASILTVGMTLIVGILFAMALNV